MTEAQHLREQAARAERLASAALDRLTVDRLLAMSREYCALADQLERSSNAASEAEAQLPN
jgi:hypothetical protein